MTREEEVLTMEEVCGPFFESMLCNHVGFLDRYDFGYVCGNCGRVWTWRKEKSA